MCDPTMLYMNSGPELSQNCNPQSKECLKYWGSCFPRDPDLSIFIRGEKKPYMFMYTLYKEVREAIS